MIKRQIEQIIRIFLEISVISLISRWNSEIKSPRTNFRFKFLIINNFKEHFLILMGQYWLILIV